SRYTRRFDCHQFHDGAGRLQHPGRPPAPHHHLPDPDDDPGRHLPGHQGRRVPRQVQRPFDSGEVNSQPALRAGSSQTGRNRSAQAPSGRGRHRPQRRAFLLDLFCDDRHARVAHDYRSRDHDGDPDHGLARKVQSRISRAGGNLRLVLALRGYRLDIFVPAALSAGETFGTRRMSVRSPTVREGWFGRRALADARASETFMSEHIVQPRVYIVIFLALMLGTTLTVMAAFYDFPGPLNAVVALTIAVIKASLVVLYFMHVRYSGRLVWLVIVAALFWLGLLFCVSFHAYL